VNRRPLGCLYRYKVGLDEREGEVLDMVQIGPAVRMIAVLGPAGVRKSAICRAICEYASHLFTAVSYVEDVREKAKHPRGFVHVQHEIVHDLCKMSDLRIAVFPARQLVLMKDLRVLLIVGPFQSRPWKD
jgi:hypothetical protein